MSIAYLFTQGGNYSPDTDGPVAFLWKRYIPRAAALKTTYTGNTPPLSPQLPARYQMWPFFHRAVVIGQPAVIPTASVGANPKDLQYGPFGATFDPPQPVVARAGTFPTIGW